MYKERVASCGQRISEALTKRAMRQADLCKLAKVPKSSLSLYLSGAYEPKQDRIFDMARVLNVSEAWLMGYNVPMERSDPKKSPSDNVDLSEGEKMWLELYHKLSDESREIMVATMESFDKLSKDKQQFVLQSLRLVSGHQE